MKLVEQLITRRSDLRLLTERLCLDAKARARRSSGVTIMSRECVCQLDLAPFDALIWPHLVFA